MVCFDQWAQRQCIELKRELYKIRSAVLVGENLWKGLCKPHSFDYNHKLKVTTRSITYRGVHSSYWLLCKTGKNSVRWTYCSWIPLTANKNSKNQNVRIDYLMEQNWNPGQLHRYRIAYVLYFTACAKAILHLSSWETSIKHSKNWKEPSSYSTRTGITRDFLAGWKVKNNEPTYLKSL